MMFPNPPIEPLARYALRAKNLEAHVARAEAVLTNLTRRLRYYTETLLPDAADDLDWDDERMWLDPKGDELLINVPEIGSVVRIMEAFKPYIIKTDGDPRREEAFTWIDKNGGRDSVTLTVTLEFKRGESERAKKMLKVIHEADPKLEIVKTKSVHYATLSRFCRDIIAKGKKQIPEALGLFHRRVAEIRPPQPWAFNNHVIPTPDAPAAPGIPSSPGSD